VLGCDNMQGVPYIARLHTAFLIIDLILLGNNTTFFMHLVPRLGNTRCTRDEFPSFAFCRVQQEPIRRFLGTMASKSLSRSTSSCYLSLQFQSQPGNIWNIIRMAMSAAIRFLTGGGETP
jgi:hypothetical protein